MSKFVEDNEIRIPLDLYSKFGTHTLFIKEDFLPFEEAREFVRKLKLKNAGEYYKLGERPRGIPSHPHIFYKDEWEGYGDFLGTGNVRYTNFLSFKEARAFVKNLNLKNYREWSEYCKSSKRPKDIPGAPNRNYKEQWKGYGDFLGTGNVRYTNFLSFKEAREFVRNLNLKSCREWVEYRTSGKRPNNIPSVPDSIYKDDWKDYGDFLGTGNISNSNQEKLSFKEARNFVRKLNLKSRTEWQKYSKSGKRPKNIPASSNTFYKDEWKGWPDFLGTNK